MIASGRPPKEVQAALRMHPYAARQVVARAREVDGERLGRAIELLADLDWAVRGGGERDPESALSLTLVAAVG